MSSLRFRIIISMFSIIFLILSGSYFVIQQIEKGIIEGEFRNEGFLLANNLASEITDDFLINDLIEMRKSVDNAKNTYPEIEYIFVTDSQGILLVHTFEGGFPRALLDFTKPENVSKEEILNTEKGVIHEFDAPLLRNIGYVHIGLSENRVNAQIQDASRKLILIAISAGILGGIFAYFIGKRLTEPLLKLNEGAKRINNGILDQKIKIISNDEMSELAGTFNDMASSLNQKIEEIVASKERIEDAEKYLETLFDSIEDGIIVINSDHKIIKINSTFLKMIDREENEVIGKTCHEIIFRNSNSEHENEVCPVNSILKSGEPIRFVHEIGSENEKKILEINLSIFYYTKGIPNIIMVLRDVTQQKILEDELLLRNRELTVLNDISRNISETFDLDKIFISSLSNILKLTNLEFGDVYLLDEKKGEFLQRIHNGPEISCDAFDHKKIKDLLMVDGLKDIECGTDENISFALLPLRSKDKILGIIAMYSRKKHIFSERDKELFSAIGNQLGVAIENISFYENVIYLKEFNDEILNNVNLALHVVDKDLKILALNNELIKLGRGLFKKEDIINKYIFSVFPFLKEGNAEMEYRHVLKSGEIFLSEDKTQYYNEIIYTNISKIPIKDKFGNVEKIITVIKDISDRKRLEEDLKDSYEELKLTYSKLQELYKLKDNFLSNISHELRTPLTSVIGFTELLLDEELNEDQRHKAQIILRNSKRLSRLIKTLFESQLIESSNMELNKQTLVINDIVASVVEDQKNMAASKKIPINIEIPDIIEINGDPERLIQVFSNILENAIKFTIKGEIIIKGKIENEKSHMMIIDTGIGIPEDKIDKIFDRFYQVDSTNKRKYGGTGLGLWISKKIIEAHGGRIWAESKNSGSTFHILLPVK